VSEWGNLCFGMNWSDAVVNRLSRLKKTNSIKRLISIFFFSTSLFTATCPEKGHSPMVGNDCPFPG